MMPKVKLVVYTCNQSDKGCVNSSFTFMYSCAVSLTDSTPTIGKRNTGTSDVTAIGIASVIQNIAKSNTQYAHFATCNDQRNTYV